MVASGTSLVLAQVRVVPQEPGLCRAHLPLDVLSTPLLCPLSSATVVVGPTIWPGNAMCKFVIPNSDKAAQGLSRRPRHYC